MENVKKTKTTEYSEMIKHQNDEYQKYLKLILKNKRKRISRTNIHICVNSFTTFP